jgi:GNAT superfamily N-acetyltransferase
MRVRAARAGDIAAMHALRMRVAENVLSDPAKVTEDCYFAYLAQGSAWVAETEDGLAGFAVLDVAGRSVWALFVAPEAEGRGMGRALHDRMIAAAEGHGLRRIFLNTAPGTRAERFYSEAGWIRTGMTKDGELRFEKVIIDRGA